MSYTKKDLQNHFSISDETVTKTLKACGLDTSTRHYSDDDIDRYFAPARALLEQEDPKKRLTYDQVAVWAKDLRAEMSKRHTKAVTNSDTEFMENFEDELADIADGIVDRIVERSLPQIPEMFGRALNRRLKDGSVRAAFHVWEQKVTDKFMSNSSERTAGLPSFGLPFSKDTVDTSATEVEDEEDDNRNQSP